MDNSHEILDAIAVSDRTFADFRRASDERMNDLERSNAKILGRKGNPFDSAGARGHAIIADNNDPEVKAFSKYLRTGNASELKALDTTNLGDGGYAVPKEIANAIESLLLAQSPIRQYASVQQTTSGDFHKLVSLGGFAANWGAESDARAATTTGTFSDVVPPSGDLWANPQASQWMVDDAFFNIGQWLAETLVDVFANAESSAFITGDGTTKPKGFLSYTNVATDDATRTFGQIQYIPTGAAGAFATVSATVSPFDCLATAIAKMNVGYRKDCAWFLSPTTLSLLATVKDTIGRPILIPAMTAGSPTMLLGYPVAECMQMPEIAANSYSIAFANMRRAYLITDRIGTRCLVDPFSNKPYLGYYTVRRTGGAVVNSQAIKLIKFAAS